MSDEGGGNAAPPARPIFANFEGGGAKGIAHIGALQAVEDNGLEIVGVAGTSAGALVATLVAIGFEARDIMGVDSAEANIQLGTAPHPWRCWARTTGAASSACFGPASGRRLPAA